MSDPKHKDVKQTEWSEWGGGFTWCKACGAVYGSREWKKGCKE